MINDSTVFIFSGSIMTLFTVIDNQPGKLVNCKFSSFLHSHISVGNNKC